MWLGIDFSGNHDMWSAGCTRSNVWIAVAKEGQTGLELSQLGRVQSLRGRDNREHPFGHLASILAGGQYRAAAIDAPFSVPAAFVPQDHASLLALVNGIECSDRQFPTAVGFVTAVAGEPPPLSPPKPLRATELHWQGLGVNARSTMWAGARGGAAFSAACMKLLSLAGRSVWPWVLGSSDGLIVEAFPAAQLQHWGLEHQGYSGNEKQHEQARECVVSYLAKRLRISEKHARVMTENADALDAVICVFAALAVTNDSIGHQPGDSASKEGWICVHKRSG